ncbi:hypothetical protein PspLS_03116 [Pyricularia sp. CBS 133598]|nr:hypothetical protein PspLS_03116 [Pyricularia sp. CBS 133598]
MLLTRPFQSHNHFQQQNTANTASTGIDANNSSTYNQRTSTDQRSNFGYGYNTQPHEIPRDIDANTDLGLDVDFSPLNADSDIALSPFSTNSWLSSSSPSLMSNADLMPTSESWYAQSHISNKPGHRTSAHHRESSLSSLGSAGPASPYSQSTTNPQIAVTDSLTDGFGGSNMFSTNDSYYHLAKSFGPGQDGSNFSPNYPNHLHTNPAATAYNHMLAQQKPKSERGLLPPPELSASSASKSRPVSVASSVASHDSPATPCNVEAEDERRQRHAGSLHVVPKLDRTMTDIYNDELYSPNFTLSTSTPSHAQPSQNSGSPHQDMFAQRLQAAQQHLSAAQTPTTTVSRDRSPFRNGSPLAPTPMHDFGAEPSHCQQRQGQAQQPRQLGFKSAQQLREQHKAEQDDEVLRQQLNRGSNAATPQTISPKDAMLEFNDNDDLSNVPLFPQTSSNGMSGFTEDELNKAVAAAAAASAAAQSNQGFGTHGLPMDTSAFTFTAAPMAPTIQIPQAYPFVGAGQMSMQQTPVSMRGSSSTPGHLSATSHSNSTHSSISPSMNSPGRPEGRISADGGTYTCTYHGCSLRFDTPALLQKHKREGHRQAHGLSASGRRTDMEMGHGGDGMTSQLLNTQHGPHKCNRINPSTGKPCNTIFSRPYDLTRHEDTIHNGRKQKVRCDLCTEEKTFSRADALTRHYRVCHPDVEFPGKHRRRGMQGSNNHH